MTSNEQLTLPLDPTTTIQQHREHPEGLRDRPMLTESEVASAQELAKAATVLGLVPSTPNARLHDVDLLPEEKVRLKRVRDAFVKRLNRAKAKGGVHFIEHFTTNSFEARHLSDYLSSKGIANNFISNGPNNFTVGVHT